MSYQLAFWQGGSGRAPLETYQTLMAEEPVEGLAPVDQGAVLDAIRTHLQGWVQYQNVWTQHPDAYGNGPGFDLDLGAQMVLFTCFGLDDDALNALIDLMKALGFPLYDPQTDQRFTAG